MNILIAGGTGLIGKKLIPKLLAENHTIFLLSRSKKEVENGISWLQWDGTSIPPISENIDAIINLCGESIASEAWTEERKKIIWESRILPTRAVVKFINEAENKPSVFLQGSAVGFYGDRNFDLLTETSSKGEGYLSDLCQEWEEEGSKASTRTVLLRTGIVLDKNGGALPEALQTFELGFGGYFGKGNQGFPWIHIEDHVGLMLHCLKDERIHGPINLVSPDTISYKQFIEAAAKIKGKLVLPAPEFVLKLILGNRSEMLLASQYIYPEKAVKMGYEFRFGKIGEALGDLLG